ncbi:MAG: efflux RND transporter periplasmic adaptor subunit [Anaerolineales bacterium]
MAVTFSNRVKTFIRRRWLVLVIVGALVIAAVSILNGVRNGQAQTLNSLQTVTAGRGNLTATIGATGSVRAQQSAILAWGTSGQVGSVTVSVGDAVLQEQLMADLALASLPQSIISAHIEFQNALSALDLEIAETGKILAEAQVVLENAERALYNLTHPGRQVDIDQAYANLILSRERLDRAREAYEPYANKPENNLERANFLLHFTEAQQHYDAALRTYNAYSGTTNSSDIAVAEGQVALAQGQLMVAQRNYDFALQAADPNFISPAEARLAAAQATLDLAAIKAPFSGVVTDAFPHPGDLVQAGLVAFQLDDLSRLLVDVEVSEVDINRVQIGQQAIISFDAAPEREYLGVVSAVSAAGSVHSGVVSFRITVELEDPDEFVRPAMTAAVNLVVTELQDVLLVPNRAVRVVDGQRVVYVLSEGSLVEVAVTLGATSETFSEVIAGDLQEGDTIVLNPPANAFEFSSQPSGGRFLMGGGN